MTKHTAGTMVLLAHNRVVDWCKGGRIVQKGRRYEIFIELMRRLSGRVKDLAASRKVGAVRLSRAK